jgi:putative nucleotidyltransferase with HDIG domain
VGDLTAWQAYPPFGGGSRSRSLNFGATSEGDRARDPEKAVATIYAYAGALALLAGALVASLIEAGLGTQAPIWALGILAAVALVAEKQPVRVDPNLEMTVSTLPILFAAVVYGPVAAMVVGAVGLVGEFRRPYARWIIWTALRALSGGFAGLCAITILSGSDSFGRLVGAVAVAAVVEAVSDVALTGVTVTLRQGGSWIVFMNSMRSIIVVTVPLYASMVVLLAFAYREISGWSVLLFFGPAFASQTLYRLYRQERDATEQLKAANATLERANLSFATALVTTLDARDRYTAGHSAAVAVYARDIAAQLQLPARDQQLAHLCGFVHDIGKIGLPPGLLEKCGPLAIDERRQMEGHPELGERILAKVESYREVAMIIRHHHERIDGCGYPDGLAREQIPLLSRIIAVADAYNAMTSDRPYRDALSPEMACIRLHQGAGTQFDHEVVAAFDAVLSSASEAYRLGSTSGFSVSAQDLYADSFRSAAA